MRKRDTRARVKRPLGLSLSRLLMPAACLWVTQSVACAAHAPEHAPCSTVHDFQDGANSRCSSSRPDGIYPIGYVTDENDGPPTPLPRSETYTSRPETAAREIKTAIEACDRAKLWDAVLGYEEFLSLVRAPLAQDTYARMIKECLAMHLQEVCEKSPVSEGEDRADTPVEDHLPLSDPKIQKVAAVPAGGQWKRPFTQVTIALFDQGQTPPKPRPPIILVESSGNWWILPRMPDR